MTDLEAFEIAKELFVSQYKEEPSIKEISYGRLEILGNHTDHQHGKCLVATASLGIRGYIAKADKEVSVASVGYPKISFPYNDLKAREEEKGTTLSLTRGVMSALARMGYKIGPFKVAMTSDIFPGAGVSSSAAYELFIGEAINHLFNDEKISRRDLALAGQYAENNYFGKASGLLDQCGSSYGGICFLDFNDTTNPVVTPIEFPSDWDVSLYLVNPGGSHAGLSDLYSEMPFDMKDVAKKLFKKEVLREVSEKDFIDALSEGKDRFLSEREKDRALHFYGEEKRVERAFEALKSHNLEAFLELERATELSQQTLLKNAMIPNRFASSPLEAAMRADLFLKKGASRVMGGGLVGTTINFVPKEEEEAFLKGMKGYYPEKNIVKVFIPSIGAHIEK